jgi:hypothetical protein
MNPWDLSASDLLVWGIVLHLIADWPLQNDWMANNKARMLHRHGHTRWWLRHPAAYVHAYIHGVLLALVFGWAAIPLAIIHLIIDTRTPVVWWSKLVKQTQPQTSWINLPRYDEYGVLILGSMESIVIYDVGTEVRFWTDQVFHIFCIAVAALLISIV